ncbi:unnamed protein product [Notodromas monacha]|uniref:Uncharacterized protein n=1 Tax=Notodromas monacha TaxID=399045 RepID=A0A7R9BV00_9CRUS|nr:unnamed protein product [Notodromas monacha]CAG0921206.1 unnamed protein product [Notodromas monacha]
MDRRTSYAARPRVNSGRPFGRFHHKPRLERPLPAPLPAAAPQQPMPNSAQQTSDEQASGPNLQYGTQAREGYEGPENPAEMEQSKESSQGAPGQPMQEDPTGVSQEQQPLPPPPPMVEDDSQQQQSRVQQPQNYCPSSQPEQQQQQQPEAEQQPPLSASPTLDTKSSNNNNKAPSDTAQGLQQQVMSKSPSAADISIKPIGPKQPIPISQESGTFARSSGPMGSQLNVSTDTKDIAAVVSSDTTSPTMDPSAAAASMAFTSINSIVTHHQADNNNTTLDNGNAVTIANYTNYDTSSTTVMSSGSASPLVPSRK